MDKDLELEIMHALNEINYYIDEYRNGNEEYLSEMITISKGILDYTKSGKKNYNKFKLILKILEIRVNLFERYILDSPAYQNLIGYISSDLEKYKEYVNELKKYASDSIGTDNYDNLEVAYLLTIELSSILYNLNGYLKEVNNISKYYASGFTYVSSDRARREGLETINKVNELIKQIKRS